MITAKELLEKEEELSILSREDSDAWDQVNEHKRRLRAAEDDADMAKYRYEEAYRELEEMKKEIMEEE
jgi:hypothetical protein